MSLQRAAAYVLPILTNVGVIRLRNRRIGARRSLIGAGVTCPWNAISFVPAGDVP